MQVHNRRRGDVGLNIQQDPSERRAILHGPFKGQPLSMPACEVRCGEVTDWSAFTRADFREAHAQVMA